MPPADLDSLPPPPDLDVPAARAAVRHYRAALAQGIREEPAWRGACELFSLHHPSWPLPLAEREAARTVGAMLARERGTAPPKSSRVPFGIVRRLADPAMPVSNVPGRPFRAALPLAGRAWPLPERLPVLRLPSASAPTSAAPC